MIAAVDIGGTKTLIALFDKKNEPIEEIQFPTPKNYEDFLIELEANINKLSATSFTQSCVAVPGMIDRVNGIGLAFGNLDWLNIPIQHDIEKILKCPVIIENDANLAGLSEARALKEKYNKVLYVTVSTGIGGGFIINDIIAPEFEDAEIGHMLLEYQGKLQRWQEFASGKAIVKNFGKKASEIDDPGQWYIIARNIAIGLIDLIAVLTPDIIILGGGVGSHFEKFSDLLESELALYDNPVIKLPKVVGAIHANEAVIYGCFLRARPDYGNNSK